ncbi:histidinol-phosphate transaminase [Streptomyces sp. RM72]|uniref:histidinol-phosphate transaminase n=1 Tax=unclassified Streptomyces TaxID=2593676 RepID=UPI00187D3F8D|nr:MULTISPECIES: histidinol-phosphate transaminase [unclassified Streptomyces]MBQ0885735.1 histidinol-phosphate transaminase [Streptomyces sp. RM72]
MSRPPTVHSLHREHERADGVLRLHCNENPYGPPSGVIASVTKELEGRCSTYPDSEVTALREALAGHVGVGTDMVAVGNGADELVLLITLASAGPGDTVVVTESTFPGYAASAAVAGATVRGVPLHRDRVSATALTEAVDDGARLVFVCNPHNPTGTVLSPAAVEEILQTCERTGAVPVFDEAYIEFAGPGFDHALDAVRAGRRLLVLRTFSKAWGLAALRAGYAVGPADLVAGIMEARRPLPFSVNRLAQQAALAALGSPDHIAEVYERTTRERERLCRALTGLGVAYVPSVTNFVMVKTPGNSTRFASRLADEHGILVRDLAPFGYPGHVRVSIGTAEDTDQFCAALGSLLASPRSHAATGHGLGAARDVLPVPTLDPVAPQDLFNGYVGAHAVFALTRLGVWDRLAEGSEHTVDGLAVQAGTDAAGLMPLLRVAALLGYVGLTDGSAPAVRLTEAGRELVRMRGFFTWGVGGYHEVLRSLPALARGTSVFEQDVDRDGGMVAVGSGEVGREMMLPLEQEVLATVDFRTVADLGCGDATRLLRLCDGRPHRRGTGIEINQGACVQANKRVADAGLADRIDIVHGDALDLSGRTFPEVDLVTSFLMMHDLFDATGDPVGVMRTLREVFPRARHFLIGDTVAQDWEERREGLPMFSVGFELVHAFMDTPIMNRGTYEDAFAGAGLRVARREPLGAPSTWLWLLSTE